MNRVMIALMAALFLVSLRVLPAVPAETGDAVVPKERTMLWNGTDFTGWKRFLPDASGNVDKTWSIADGLLRCMGSPAGYMRTETPYADYHLHVEWRWPAKPGNNGVLVPITVSDPTLSPSTSACKHSCGRP